MRVEQRCCTDAQQACMDRQSVRIMALCPSHSQQGGEEDGPETEKE